MKIESGMFIGFAIFYILVGFVYNIVTGDVVGTTVISLTGGLAVIIGFYLRVTGKRVGVRPEDRDAEIDEADSSYGFFSPHSWWPLPVAVGAWVVFMGLVFATWLLVFGVFILLLSVFGWLFEYHRGDFAE